MMTLTEDQNKQVMNRFPRYGWLIIKLVEKYGDPKDSLEDNMEVAYDIALEHAE